MFAIIALIAALVVPHGAYPGGHASATANVADDHAVHAAHHDDYQTDGQEMLLDFCDAMAGHCFVAVETGSPSTAVHAARASRFASITGRLLAGLTIAHEPPPPRV